MEISTVQEKITNQNYDLFSSLQFRYRTVPNDVEENIKGFVDIYKFIKQQYDGWKNYGTGTLPGEFTKSVDYISKWKSFLISFVGLTEQNQDYLKRHWDQNTYTLNQNVGKIFLSDSPETKFLVDLYQNDRAYFRGAYAYFTNDFNQGSLNRDSLTGFIIAYEFSFKNSHITDRRKADKYSLDQLKFDFKKYKDRSELELTDVIKSIGEKFENTIANFNDSTDNKIKQVENFINEKEVYFNNWTETTDEKTKNFFKDAETQRSNLEKAYVELLALSKPVQYWNLRAAHLKKQGWKFLKILIGVILLGSGSLFTLLWFTPETILQSFYNGNHVVAIRWSIIFVTFISFLYIAIRALLKTTFSSFHLARDAEERENLTYVYAAMIKDGMISNEERSLVMQALFSRSDTGLLKEDSSPTMPGAGEIIGKIATK